MSRVRIVATWVLQILCGALFVLVGTGKFADPSWSRNFERWGYPPGTYLIVGVVEAAAGLGLLVPRVAPYAAATLMAVMIGAAATHAWYGETRRLTAPLVYLAILALIAWLRRPRRAGPSAPPLAATRPAA